MTKQIGKTDQEKDRDLLKGIHEAKHALHGKNLKFRDPLAEAIFGRLNEYREFFKSETRAAIANRLSEELGFAKSAYPDTSKTDLVVKIEQSIENSIDASHNGIPIEISIEIKEIITQAMLIYS